MKKAYGKDHEVEAMIEDRLYDTIVDLAGDLMGDDWDCDWEYEVRRAINPDIPLDEEHEILLEEVNLVRDAVYRENGYECDPCPYVREEEEHDYWEPDMSAAEFVRRYQMGDADFRRRRA